MVRSQEISIVIHGPWHQHAEESISTYQKYGQVIVACKPSDIRQVEAAFPEVGNLCPKNRNLDLVAHPLPAKYYTNNHHIFEHAWNVYSGLALATNPLAIKIRSDEKYSNLDKFIEAVRFAPSKLTTNNIFFKKHDQEPFHPSDHVMGCETILLKQTFGHVVECCLLNADYPKNLPLFNPRFCELEWIGYISPEVIFFLSFLWQKGVKLGKIKDKPDWAFIKKIMLENLQCVNVEDMGPYIWSKNTNEGRKFYSDFLENDNSISSLKEL